MMLTAVTRKMSISEVQTRMMSDRFEAAKMKPAAAPPLENTGSAAT